MLASLLVLKVSLSAADVPIDLFLILYKPPCFFCWHPFFEVVISTVAFFPAVVYILNAAAISVADGRSAVGVSRI
jgi:hypothetical protein